MRRLGLFIATCGYIGYAPVAPGTFGSAAGLVVFAAVRSSGSPIVEAAVIAILFLIGVWSGTEAEHHFGGVDPAPVVMDEVVGMLITLAFIPVTWMGAVGEGAAANMTALGDVVNVASRLASLAGPGEILLTADAALAAGVDTTTLPHKQLELKGRQQLTEVVSLRSAQPAAAGQSEL